MKEVIPLSALRRNILIFVLLPNLLLLVISLVYGNITREAICAGEDVVSCIFKKNMHLYCPGCGGSRALVYLLNFDLLRSFIYYPPLLVSIIFILDLDLRAFISFLKNDFSFLRSFRTKFLILIPIFIIANFIIRNVLLVAFGIDFIGDVI